MQEKEKQEVQISYFSTKPKISENQVGLNWEEVHIKNSLNFKRSYHSCVIYKNQLFQ